MRKITFILACLTTALIATPPEPGDISADVTFSLSANTSGTNLDPLTDGLLSNFAGKVVLIAYYTPW